MKNVWDFYKIFLQNGKSVRVLDTFVIAIFTFNTFFFIKLDNLTTRLFIFNGKHILTTTVLNIMLIYFQIKKKYWVRRTLNIYWNIFKFYIWSQTFGSEVYIILYLWYSIIFTCKEKIRCIISNAKCVCNMKRVKRIKRIRQH